MSFQQLNLFRNVFTNKLCIYWRLLLALESLVHLQTK